MSTVTDKPVTSRVVTRYYFNGKGYATKRLAYTAKAKKLLIELVLGPYVERSDPSGEVCWQELARVSEYRGDGNNHYSKEAWKAWCDEQFARFFPHEQGASEKAIGPGCLDVKGPYECRIENEDRDQYGRLYAFDFAFKSCNWSQDQWVKAKVAELIREDAAKGGKEDGK